MNYDKNSFLSGLAVGRQLKGWATAMSRPMDTPRASAMIAGVQSAAAFCELVSAALTDAITVTGILHFGDLILAEASVALSGSLSFGAFSESAVISTVTAFGASVEYPGALPDQIIVNAITMEVIT